MPCPHKPCQDLVQAHLSVCMPHATLGQPGCLVTHCWAFWPQCLCSFESQHINYTPFSYSQCSSPLLGGSASWLLSLSTPDIWDVDNSLLQRLPHSMQGVEYHCWLLPTLVPLHAGQPQVSPDTAQCPLVWVGARTTGV